MGSAFRIGFQSRLTNGPEATVPRRLDGVQAGCRPVAWRGGGWGAFAVWGLCAWLGLRCSWIPKGRGGAWWPSGSGAPEVLRPGSELDGVREWVEAEPGGGAPARDSEGAADGRPGARDEAQPASLSACRSFEVATTPVPQGVSTDLRTEPESLSLLLSGSGHLRLPSLSPIASLGRPS